METSHLATQLEGLLYALGKPLSRAEAARLLDVKADEIEQAIGELNSQSGGVVVVDDGRQIELRVAPEAAKVVEDAQDAEYSRDIGRAGLEVLAAILYRGPLTRAEIDFIRGVNSSQTLRTLSMRGLVRRVANPKDGALPDSRRGSFIYEPTTELLATLGVKNASDLPEHTVVRDKLTSLEHSYREVQGQQEEQDL
jgi:segregation and condensation protein B